MAVLTIVAKVTAKEEKIEDLQRELKLLTLNSRTEKGCMGYDMFQDLEDPKHFMLVETWESKKLWQEHLNHQNLNSFKKLTENFIEETQVYQMSQTL